MQKRPLSPHLQIYKPQITSVMSITHRATGVALSFGSVLLVVWLWAAAYNESYFNLIQQLFLHPIGEIILVGWTFALFYHLGNGLPHLSWDAGHGFEIKSVTRSGVVVIFFAVAMTAITWVIVCQKIYGGVL